MQIHSIHATIHQMQLLRSSGALKGAYCKLIRITDAVKLCQSFGLGIPDNVKEECQPYEEVCVCVSVSVCLYVCVLNTVTGHHIAPVPVYPAVLMGTWYKLGKQIPTVHVS